MLHKYSYDLEQHRSPLFFCMHDTGMLPASRHSCKGDCPIRLENFPKKKKEFSFCVWFV